MESLVIVLIAFVALAVLFVVFIHWKGLLTSMFLSRCFFIFGMVCAAFAIATQYGLTTQVGSQNLFADPIFYLLLGTMSLLSAVYWNTDKTNRII